MFDYYLFDLDGTLTDPAEGITNSFIHALKSFGKEVPSYEKLCTFIGPPLHDTFKNQLGFPEDSIKDAIVKYREHFSVKGLFENQVYDGIEQMLKELKNRGKHLLVATSKAEEFSIRILEHFKLASYFDFICGSNMNLTRSSKEEIIAYALERCGNPDKKSVLMIGDRHYDIEGAHQNGVKACGVLYGYGTREELESAGADYIAEKVLDILDI